MSGPMSGQIKSGQGPAINFKAKRLVCNELTRRAVAAQPGPKNTGVINVDGNATTIRVKARTSQAKGWRWNLRDGVVFSEIAPHDFSILVDLNDGKTPVGYFIVPTGAIDERLNATFKEWVETVGPKGPRDPNNPTRFLDQADDWKWLERYREWSPLLECLGAHGDSPKPAPEYGQIKAGKGTLIGNAGEYFVVGELLKRGIVAALAPRNTPGFDVIAVEGDASANIRVKSKTDASKSWAWNAKNDGVIFRSITDNDFTVLVDLKRPGESPEFYVLRTIDVDDILKRDFQTWADTPGRGGRRRNPANKVRRLGWWLDNPALLEMARGNWKLITSWLQREALAHEGVGAKVETVGS